MDIYDELKSVSAAEGWTESTEVRIVCEYIQNCHPFLNWLLLRRYSFVDFLKTKQEAA